MNEDELARDAASKIHGWLAAQRMFETLNKNGSRHVWLHCETEIALTIMIDYICKKTRGLQRDDN